MCLEGYTLSIISSIWHALAALCETNCTSILQSRNDFTINLWKLALRGHPQHLRSLGHRSTDLIFIYLCFLDLFSYDGRLSVGGIMSDPSAAVTVCKPLLFLDYFKTIMLLE